jgi:hypothetical protein
MITSFSGPSGLTEGGMATFVVVVTDPEGLADIGGGSLQSPTGARYGTFVLIGPGQFQFSLSWSEIAAVEPINFVTQESRTFVASIFDAGGNTTTAEAQVRLNCDALGGQGLAGACGGHCLALNTNQNCGACGAGCGGTCLSPGSCQYVEPLFSTSPGTCAGVCAAHQGNCTAAVVNESLEMDQRPVDCSYASGQSHQVQGRLTSIVCACTEAGGWIYPELRRRWNRLPVDRPRARSH